MPKFTPLYNRIGENLVKAQNYLYEVVQKKLDEGKDQATIIKEIKKEFAPNEHVICDIENTFFKKAYIGPYINEMYEEGEISDKDFRDIGTAYRELENKFVFQKGKTHDEFERAFTNWIRINYPNIYEKTASNENIDISDIPEIDFSKVSYIKKLPGKEKWRVFSESGKNMGTFDSMAKAKKHLKEIEFFKRKKSLKNPYKKLSYNDLNLAIGDEVQIIKETVVVFNEFEITLPEGAFGVVTKVNPLVAQFDIDDIGMYNIETNEIDKEVVEKQFQDKYGHYFTVQLDDEFIKPVIEMNKENIPIKIWNNKKAESWLEQAKPGDKVQLDGGETGEITTVSDEKVEVRTPTKTETVWKKKQ